MIRSAFIIIVVKAVRRFTVNAYDPAGMLDRTGKTVSPGLREALAAGFIFTAGVPAAHQNIALTAALASVIGTIFHCTF